MDPLDTIISEQRRKELVDLWLMKQDPTDWCMVCHERINDCECREERVPSNNNGS